MRTPENLSGQISELVQNATSEEQRATVIASEEIIIGYYCDMAPIMPEIISTGYLPKTLPPQDLIRKAITELNRACAEQRRGYIFNGRIDRIKDRFQFAASVAGEPAM